MGEAAAIERLRVMLVGGGKMGEAILGGWLRSREGAAAEMSPESFCVAEPSKERREWLTSRHGVSCVGSASRPPFVPDMVVLAVKPQVMFDVLKELSVGGAYGGGQAGPLFVSIAAGLSTSQLEAALPEGARVVRVMPNTPLAVGAGASGVCAGASATKDDLELVRGLFGCLGKAFVVDEADMDAVCAVSGSGPAYVAALVEAVREGGRQAGLSADFAEELFLQTVLGTARLMDEEGQSAEQTRIAVCSPGGTTLAALDAMQQAGFAAACVAGVEAAKRRSKELSGAC